MEKDFKLFLNNLKCPVCQFQIDIDSKYINYVCVQVPEHYLLSVNYAPIIIGVGLPSFSIRFELVKFHYDRFFYQISKQYTSNTEIYVFPTDEEGRFYWNNSNPPFYVDNNSFDFANFNTKEAVDRINIMMTFQ